MPEVLVTSAVYWASLSQAPGDCLGLSPAPQRSQWVQQESSSPPDLGWVRSQRGQGVEFQTLRWERSEKGWNRKGASET